MQWIKIQIPDRSQSVTAFYEMAAAEGVSIVISKMFTWSLNQLCNCRRPQYNLPRTRSGGFDYAIKTLRDTTAAHAQRRQSDQPREALSDA